MQTNRSLPQTSRQRLSSFLVLSAISVAILLSGFVLGTEPRLILERTEGRVFRVTTSNHFAGRPFYSKTIEGVTEVLQGDADRNRRGDSAKKKRQQRKQKHLDFFGTDEARVGWDRETDQVAIEEFMRGSEPTMYLEDPLPLWRMVASWFCIGLGGLSLVGAIRNGLLPSSTRR
jgi:hypothetical protein